MNYRIKDIIGKRTVYRYNDNEISMLYYDRKNIKIPCACHKSNTMGVTCGAGTAYTSGSPEFISDF